MSSAGALAGFEIRCDICDRRVESEVENDTAKVEPIDAEDEDGMRVVLVMCSRCSKRTVIADGGEA